MLTSPSTGVDVAPLVLIADGDEDSRLLYTEFLHIHRWRVTGAAGGPEALAKAIAEHPDVVLSETRLPGFDGVILSELLRRDWITAHIPIVFVTSDATAANLARAAASGASAVLTKPCMPDAVMTAIDRASRRSRDLPARSTAALGLARTQVARANQTLERVLEQRRIARSLKSSLRRGDTILPPIEPPTITCPRCDERLRYLRSYVGGVSEKHREQWDYFECPHKCGTFEYRARTRKLRRAPPP